MIDTRIYFYVCVGNVVSYLNVSVADVLHGGYYTCLARNILGLKSHSAMIKIYGMINCLLEPMEIIKLKY